MSFRGNSTHETRSDNATLAVLVAASSSLPVTPPLLSIWTFPCVHEDSSASLLHSSWLSSNSSMEGGCDAKRIPKRGSVAWLRGGFSVVASASAADYDHKNDEDFPLSSATMVRTAQLEMTDFADAALGRSGAMNAADDASGAQWCLSRDSIYNLVVQQQGQPPLKVLRH